MTTTYAAALGPLSNLNNLADAIRGIDLGALLTALTAPTTGIALVASDTITLPSLPMKGFPVKLTGNVATTSELLNEQLGGTVVAGGFKVDYDTGVVTFEGSQFANDEPITYSYVPQNGLAAALAATLVP